MVHSLRTLVLGILMRLASEGGEIDPSNRAVSRCGRGEAGGEWQWLECCLLEPQDMVHPGPDSSDGCASGTDQTFQRRALGEHLLAAAQTSMPRRARNGDAFSSTELVEIPAGATSWSLAGQVDGCCRPKISTCVFPLKCCAEQVKAYRLRRSRTAKSTGGSIGVQIRESPKVAWWCATFRTRGSVGVGCSSKTE